MALLKTLVSAFALSAVALAGPIAPRESCDSEVVPSDPSVVTNPSDPSVITNPSDPSGVTNPTDTELVVTTGPGIPVAAGRGQISVSEFYKVFPQKPTEHRPAVPYLHLEATSNQSFVEQVAVFRGIPAGAKNCRLNYHLPEKKDRVFFDYGNPADAKVQQLDEFSIAEGGNAVITWDSLLPFPRIGRGENLAFNTWSFSGTGVNETQSAGFWPDCQEEIYLQLKLASYSSPDPRREPVIFFMPTEKSDIFISYDFEDRE